MKTPRIANAIGQIDDDLVTDAAKCKKKNKKHWLKWGSLAACFAVLVIAGAAILPSLFRENVTPEGTDSRYKDFSIQASESAIVWPWEYQTVYEKYRNVEIDGIEYHGKGRVVSEAWIGERIGNYTVVGYDEVNNGKKYSAEFEAYALKDIAQCQFIAVKMEDSYYVFQNDEYAPPNTLGELMDVVNLSEVVELQRFSEGDNSPDSKHFALSSDDYVWEVLSECRNAPFVEDQTWTVGDRSYLSFTITSEALGVYKVALYVTEDGYLWTNAFNWQYLFIKITEEYILVDDSILCKNPADGITYKVLLNDLRISRYVDYGIVKVGDTVQISYEGEIDETSGNTIAGAISAFKATISDGDVLIPE